MHCEAVDWTGYNRAAKHASL